MCGYFAVLKRLFTHELFTHELFTHELASGTSICNSVITLNHKIAGGAYRDESLVFYNIHRCLYKSEDDPIASRCLLHSMADHGLISGSVSVSNRLGRIDNISQFFLFLRSEIDVPGSPILLQTVSLGRTRDGNQALRRYPGQCNLGQRTALSSGDFLDLFHDSFVLVEVLALEFWYCRP